MWDSLKLIALGLAAVLAAIAANYAHDLAYMVNAVTVMLAAGIAFIYVLRHMDEPRPSAAALEREYLDGVVRAGVIATAGWATFSLASRASPRAGGMVKTTKGRLRESGRARRRRAGPRRHRAARYGLLHASVDARGVARRAASRARARRRRAPPRARVCGGGSGHL